MIRLRKVTFQNPMIYIYIYIYIYVYVYIYIYIYIYYVYLEHEIVAGSEFRI